MTTWNERIDQFWSDAEDSQPEAALAAMRSLIAERSEDDPDAVYELASVYDFLGLEHEAVPLYQQALALGLAGVRRPQAIIQLASSLRNIGDPDAAIELLQDLEGDAVTGAAPQAFLALALHDVGKHDEALRVVLLALAPTLPLYRRSAGDYANALVDAPDSLS